jgi:transposase-like protein
VDLVFDSKGNSRISNAKKQDRTNDCKEMELQIPKDMKAELLPKAFVDYAQADILRSLGARTGFSWI